MSEVPMYQPITHDPLAGGEGKTYKVSRTCTSKPKPEPGLDCPTCAIFVSWTCDFDAKARIWP